MSKKAKNKINQEIEVMTDVINPEYLGKELANGQNDYSDLPIKEQHALKCRDKLVNAVRSSEKAYMDLATGLYEAHQHEEYYEVWGCNFSEFADRQLGIGETRAYLLKDIGAFVANPDNRVTVEQANSIGWTKMSVIATAAKKNKELPIGILLEEAKSLKVKELQERVKGSSAPAKVEEDYGIEDKEKSDMKETAARDAKHASLKLALVYESDQAAFVREAIGYAANELNLDTEDKKTASQAIEHICQSWIEMKNVSPVGLTLNDWTKFLEKKYGVKLVQTIEEDQSENFLGGFEIIEDTKDNEQSIEEMLAEDEDLKNLAGVVGLPQ